MHGHKVEKDKRMDSTNVYYMTVPKLSEANSDADFGAVGDGETKGTLEIQRIADAIHNAGGGVVYFQSGT